MKKELSRDPMEVYAKVADFGLSRQAGTAIEGSLPTWRWLAPEVVSLSKSTSYDERSDIYSFGIVLWEIATLSRPFMEYREREVEVRNSIIGKGLRPSFPPASCSSEVPPEYEKLVQECWVSDPARRPNFSHTIRVLCSLLNLDPATHLDTQSSSSFSGVQAHLLSGSSSQQIETARGFTSRELLLCEIRDRSQKLAKPVTAMVCVGVTVCLGMDDGAVAFWDLINNSIVSIVSVGTERIKRLLQVDEDHVWAASGSKISVLNVNTMSRVKELKSGHECLITAMVVVMHNERQIWTGDGSGRICVWTINGSFMEKFTVDGAVLSMIWKSSFVVVGSNKWLKFFLVDVRRKLLLDVSSPFVFSCY